MAKNVDDVIGDLRPEQRQRVEARAAELIAEEEAWQRSAEGRKLRGLADEAE